MLGFFLYAILIILTSWAWYRAGYRAGYEDASEQHFSESDLR